MTDLEQAILRTIVYADCFDYTLSSAQIHYYLISQRVYPISALEAALSELATTSVISNLRGLYCLTGREKLFQMREITEAASATKIEIARKKIRFMTIIPWIDGIWITGNVAMNNARDDDDIDLLVITRESYLWLTRFLLLILFGSVGRLRLRRHLLQSVKNKLCLNMYLDATALAMPRNKQNLYTAHEVAQVLPLLNRNATYERFLAANSWVLDFLPHIQGINEKKHAPLTPQKSAQCIQWLNRWLFKAQYDYMKKHLSRELVDEHRAFFHPRNTSKMVITEYTKRCIAHNIPV